MKLGDISAEAVRPQLQAEGLMLGIGPFAFRLISPIGSVADGLITLYQDYPVLDNDEFVDYTVTIAPGSGVRHWIGKQAVFFFDGAKPFVPLPIGHAFPLLEWAMNWCISMHAHHFLFAF